MWGADTPLVIDALVIAGMAALAGAGLVGLRLRNRRKSESRQPDNTKPDLEDRVRVLERIATDRTQDLADEIDQLRSHDKAREVN
ncbi:hypothetical protein [Erythrobacter sp. JK5]|uniref:hypothetical protein n=1 Tax=Erythrobacter sp. JK5 TaxID=2829500 RepID=UPI001BA747EA|nr:hypothetical protein [Erythrobacter sp. JK5]QUL39524.1 hypothetical protein KDC96_01270 [Erythrobacter sp. JK5]